MSSHAFCGSVSQSGASQKKTLHHGAHTLVRSPLIPLLRPKQQLGRLEARTPTHTLTLSFAATSPARRDPVETGGGFHQERTLTGASASIHPRLARITTIEFPLTSYVLGSSATSEWTLSFVRISHMQLNNSFFCGSELTVTGLC